MSECSYTDVNPSLHMQLGALLYLKNHRLQTEFARWYEFVSGVQLSALGVVILLLSPERESER